MRIFKNKWFIRFTRKEKIDDVALCEAIGRAERRLIDADLGGGLIKQRVARVGEGRSGGYRTIIVYRSGRNAFFVFGFATSARASLEPAELAAFKGVAGFLLKLDDQEIATQIALGELKEVNCNGQDLQK